MIVNDSERLTFALMDENDTQLLFDLDQDEEVMKYINGGKKSTMEDIHNVMIPRMYKYRNEDKGWGLWKVIVRESNEFIGWVLVRPMDFFNENPQWDNLELGWRFMRKSWGKGFATEAANALKQALIDHGGIDKLCAVAVPDNMASIGIMKKIGMSYIKTYVHKDPLGDLEAVYYELNVKLV
ncbi:MAG: GNAT family N-acetyltransferase [Kangiellaceae bacterium]|nr:GNAT family N-acetyltransferase [Kangiellaceae bacterium]MCW8999771.1 GNAT family N-acetyltransferase [Kangiellaceae bacterium]MCW9017843.1 GNAT family N-acetyltransferase [Kangiellaceae bacterium]